MKVRIMKNPSDSNVYKIEYFHSNQWFTYETTNNLKVAKDLIIQLLKQYTEKNHCIYETEIQSYLH